jgi:hypothetical protein
MEDLILFITAIAALFLLHLPEHEGKKEGEF